jgi:hypothetical protein
MLADRAAMYITSFFGNILHEKKHNFMKYIEHHKKAKTKDLLLLSTIQYGYEIN